MCLSVLIASIAALNSIFSSVIDQESLATTSESLGLTRATQRPFLNVVAPVYYSLYPATISKIAPAICNKGVFPAEKVSVQCAVCHNALNAKKHLLALEEENPSIHFPDETIRYTFEEKGSDPNALKIKSGDELRVYITISYKNKLTQNKHKTVRSYLIQCNPPTDKAALIPLPEGDYWD